MGVNHTWRCDERAPRVRERVASDCTPSGSSSRRSLALAVEPESNPQPRFRRYLALGGGLWAACSGGFSSPPSTAQPRSANFREAVAPRSKRLCELGPREQIGLRDAGSRVLRSQSRLDRYQAGLELELLWGSGPNETANFGALWLTGRVEATDHEKSAVHRREGQAQWWPGPGSGSLGGKRGTTSWRILPLRGGGRTLWKGSLL